MRVLIILAMVWQPLMLAVAHQPSGPGQLTGMSCSAELGKSSCCEMAPAALHCPPPADPCRCGVQPGEVPDESPDAPLPKTQRDSVVTILSRAPSWVPLRAHEKDAKITSAGFSTVRSNKTHNELQATLGIWQT